jgi:hypothetical protein
MKVFHELDFEAGLGSFKICILNAQNELAAQMSREKEVIQGSARVADMEQAGGGRRESNAGNSSIHGSTE